MKQIVIKQNSKKQLNLLFTCTTIVILSLIVILSGSDFFGSIIAAKVICTISAIFFSVCLAFIAKRFFNPKDILIINEEGFIDNSAASSVGFIPWSFVDKIYTSTVSAQKFISIDINNVDKFLENISQVKRIGIKANMALGYAPISITLNSTDKKCKDILPMMLEYFDNYNSKE